MLSTEAHIHILQLITVSYTFYPLLNGAGVNLKKKNNANNYYKEIVLGVGKV